MELLDPRKEALLKLTVRLHIETAEPVGSAALAEASGLDVSPATIRNELADLESQGYLTHPHTSAGRIPTELGYRTYVDRFMEKKPLVEDALTQLRESIAEAADVEERLRRAAKALAAASAETALVGFAPRDVYYTGIANLFAQPEFRQVSQVTTMSQVLDHLDETMERIFPTVGSDVGIFLGRTNPFGAECGTLATRLSGGGIVALLGPMRMDYDRNWSLLAGLAEILK